MHPIGVIRTPYTDSAPFQPLEVVDGEFYIDIDKEFEEGLYKLQDFRYIYVLFHIDRPTKKPHMRATPPWTGGEKVGIFASRSPNRPNRIGLSVVRLKSIDGRRIYTSCMDVFDGTPLLDIKPYIKDLDSKSDANYGWVEELGGKERLQLHIKGIPHSH